MGLLNATTATAEGFIKEHGHSLVEGEQIHVAFKAVRDWIVFTDWRVIHVDVQGITGSKKEYKSVPYRSINAYAIESAGTFDLDGEIKLFVSGLGGIQFKVGRDSDVSGLQSLLAEKLRS
ncbi:MAG: PH domain-containing protein [Alteraurantiacibacter sp.]